MNNKGLLETARELLKAAKEKPEQFQEITKASAKNMAPAANGQAPMKKDDMPHAPNSPQDKAHDVAESDDSLNHALKILDTPEKQKAMLAHLRTLHDPGQQRSEANREAGETPAEERAEHKAPMMEKSEVIKLAKDLIKAAQDPKQFEEMKKAMAAPKAPAAAPAVPKMAAPKMAAPKAPAMPKAPKAPAMPKAPKMGKCMTKDEIKADMAGEWKPRFRKEKC